MWGGGEETSAAQTWLTFKADSSEGVSTRPRDHPLQVIKATTTEAAVGMSACCPRHTEKSWSLGSLGQAAGPTPDHTRP